MHLCCHINIELLKRIHQLLPSLHQDISAHSLVLLRQRVHSAEKLALNLTQALGIFARNLQDIACDAINTHTRSLRLAQKAQAMDGLGACELTQLVRSVE